MASGASNRGELTSEIELDRDPYGISHVFEYRHAAESLLRTPTASHGLLARPICYLARHALELALKNALALADAEYHQGDVGYRPFQKSWPSHDLNELVETLDRLLKATGNAGVPARTRDIILRLHSLDPDGQRFRYAKARVRGGEAVLSLPKETRVNLTALVTDIDNAIDCLFDLDPESPRNRRERRERLEALAATQRLPVHLVEKGFGTRRSADGYVLLPTSVVPEMTAGELVRLMTPDRFDLAWKILRVDGSDYVLDHFGDSLRLSRERVARTVQQGHCPVCSSRRILPVEASREATVVFEAGVVHDGLGPPLHSPDRLCRSCGHRFESLTALEAAPN